MSWLLGVKSKIPGSHNCAPNLLLTMLLLRSITKTSCYHL